MSAERLREAARVLRERAEAATPRPTLNRYAHGGGRAYVITDEERTLVADYYQEGDREFYATMHPGVGLALADWLDTAGADLWAHGPLCECGSGCTVCDDDVWQPHVRRALAVAALILGEQP